MDFFDELCAGEALSKQDLFCFGSIYGLQANSAIENVKQIVDFSNMFSDLKFDFKKRFI